MNLENCKVLYLEDNLALAQSSMTLFKALGLHEIEHVVSIEDALDELEQDQYDLCILDFWIAGQTSALVIEQAQNRSITVVLISGDEPPLPFRDKIPSHCQLLKPVTLEVWKKTFAALDRKAMPE